MVLEKFESMARACTTFEELKECVIKMASCLEINDSESYADQSDFEKVEERVGFIEDCLQANDKKINIDALRL